MVGQANRGATMRASLFWFDDEQWAKIEPLIPMNRPGPKAQDNRRILSGIMHVIKTGCRWQDTPPEYGPYTTVYNRFNRWSGRGIWQQIFETVAGSPEPPEQVALDKPPVNSWSPDAIEAARQMWFAGDSASVIARTLDISRNAVLGKAWREGWPR
jgi:transposase